MVSRAALFQFCLAMAVGYWLAGPLLLRLRWLPPPPARSRARADAQLPSEPPAVPRALLLKPDGVLPLQPDGALPLQPAGTAGPFDLDRRRGLRAAVAARAAHGGELVLFTSNAFGIPSAVNMALQLRRLSIEHHLVLADTRETCSTAQRTWPWLGCGWSRGMRGFTKRYGESKQVILWELWSAKWLTVARLAELKVNVLALDTDMMILDDPYPLLRSEAMRGFQLVLPPEGSRVNLGFLYVRGASMGARGGVVSLLYDVVRRIRLFVEDWTLLNHRGQPHLLGLWDQVSNLLITHMPLAAYCPLLTARC